MKIVYVLFLCLLSSCAQNIKEQKEKTEEETALSQEEIINSVVKTLHLDQDEIKLGTIVSKVFPSNSDEIIIIIPEIVNEEEDIYELNSHIVIANTTTANIKHKYFESSKTNGWISDAVFIEDIAIEDSEYKLNDSVTAFGVMVKFRNNSQPNPYSTSVVSLYAKKNHTLQKLLDNFTTYESLGEVSVNFSDCYADIVKEKNELKISDITTNGYYDITVLQTITQINYAKDENEECNPIEKSKSEQQYVLKFNNEAYEAIKAIAEENTVNFDTLIANTKTRALPITDSTNFDDFIDEDDYKVVDVKGFKLIDVYPNFYKEGYNFKAIASYKIEMSHNFHTTVITVRKGNNEMESVLINYNLNGDVIDYEVVAYDETAEGIARITSKIENHTIERTYTLWLEEKEVSIERFEIDEEGNIKPEK